jgi:hypothetical protein
MMELPGSLRDMIIARIDEEIETNDADSPELWLNCVLAGLDVAAEELDEEIGENLVTKLEESGELEQSFSAEFKEQFAELDEPSGEDLMSIIDSTCEVVWINEDGDDQIARGFMESDGYEDEDY